MKDFDEKLLALIKTYQKKEDTEASKEELFQEIKMLFMQFLLHQGDASELIEKQLKALKTKFHPDKREQQLAEIKWVEAFSDNKAHSELIHLAEEVTEELIKSKEFKKIMASTSEVSKLSDFIHNIELQKNQLKPKYLSYWFLNSLENMLKMMQKQQGSADDFQQAWAALFSKSLPFISSTVFFSLFAPEIASFYALGLCLHASGSILDKQKNLLLPNELSTIATITGRTIVTGSTIAALKVSELNFLMAHFLNLGVKKSLNYLQRCLWGKVKVLYELDQASPLSCIAESLSTYVRLTKQQWLSVYRKGGQKSEYFELAVQQIEKIDKLQITLEEKMIFVGNVLKDLESKDLLKEDNSRSGMALFCAKLMFLSISSAPLSSIEDKKPITPIDRCIQLLEKACDVTSTQSFLSWRQGSSKLEQLSQKIDALKVLRIEKSVSDEVVKTILLGDNADEKIKLSSSNTDNALLRAWKIYENSQPSEISNEKTFP